MFNEAGSLIKKVSPRLTDMENRLALQWGGGMGERRLGSLGGTDAKLLYIERINNKVLLYSVGNYIQYPMINHNGKEYEIYIYIFITESLFCIAEINTML